MRVSRDTACEQSSSSCQYVPFYCEENVYHLTFKLTKSGIEGLSVVFISNNFKQVMSANKRCCLSHGWSLKTALEPPFIYHFSVFKLLADLYS